VLLDVDGCYANKMPFALQTPLVSLCATRFDIKKFYVLFAPYVCIFFFFMDISTDGGFGFQANFGCITETECVYCAVRIECLNELHLNFPFHSGNISATYFKSPSRSQCLYNKRDTIVLSV
jgi:hypothetical protein